MTHPTFSSTRHLVDPEVAPMLEAFPVLNLSPETLPTVREVLTQPVPDAPDPNELFPNVSSKERFIPGAEGHPDVRVLHYRPVGVEHDLPVLVWIHGGGFVLGNADGDEMRCRQISDELQAVVVSVDYRLAPEVVAPVLVEDCYAALLWVSKNAVELKVDPLRIAVGGMSAGGGLAAGTALLARDRQEVEVCFQLLIYSMLDDRTAVRNDPHPYTGEFIWTCADNHFGWSSMLGHAPGIEGVSPYAAPSRATDLGGLPPTYIAVGSLDLFLDEDLEFASRLLKVGVPTELHVYPGGFHAYDLFAEARVSQATVRDYFSALKRAFPG